MKERKCIKLLWQQLKIKYKVNLSDTRIIVMAARITIDELNERLDIIKKTKNIALVGEFQSGKNIRNSFKCLTCEYEFKSTLWMMHKGPQGCGRCSGKVLTPQDITDRLKVLHDRGILFEDVYTNITARYNFRCLNCDYTWNAALKHLHHSGTGCGRCNKVRLSEQDIQDKILEMKARGIELLEPYKSMTTKHRFKCHKHDFEWLATFDNISRGKGCTKCAGRLKSEIERESIRIHRSIRQRLSGMYSKGEINVPVHNDKSMMKILLDHCKSQYHLLPPRPIKLGVKYELDHIIPISRVSPYDINHLCLVWDVRNLQWLTKEANISKYNKIMPEYFTDWHYETCKKLGIEV